MAEQTQSPHVHSCSAGAGVSEAPVTPAAPVAAAGVPSASAAPAAPQKVLMKGNEVLAESAIRAGCRFFFGYPITPQTELAAYMSKRMPKENGTYLQAESEISAINMVYGAAAAGARAMTSSSSPGVSLKGEGVSYMAGADLPGVIINVQRGGPGLGGIQPSQSDYWQATRAMGHGDFFMPVFAPSTVQEMADLVYHAFDVADEYRTPVMILADGMLGQMMEPVTLPPRRALDELPAKPWATTGTRGTRFHNVANSLYLTPEELERTNVERFERYEQIRAHETRSESYLVEDADIVIAAFGASARIVRSAVASARARGIRAGLIRPVTLWPFPSAAFSQAAERGAKAFLSVEMNMGQMVDDVRLAVNGAAPVEFFGRTGGIIPTPAEVLAKLERMADELGLAREGEAPGASDPVAAPVPEAAVPAGAAPSAGVTTPADSATDTTPTTCGKAGE